MWWATMIIKHLLVQTYIHAIVIVIDLDVMIIHSHTHYARPILVGAWEVGRITIRHKAKKANFPTFDVSQGRKMSCDALYIN